MHSQLQHPTSYSNWWCLSVFVFGNEYIHNQANPMQTEFIFLRGEHWLDRLSLGAAPRPAEAALSCFLLQDLVLLTCAYPCIITNCYYTAWHGKKLHCTVLPHPFPTGKTWDFLSASLNTDLFYHSTTDHLPDSEELLLITPFASQGHI